MPPVRCFNKLLIANRGEIACRVIKTARKMGVRSVAVYSPDDRNAPHVYMADEAYALASDDLAHSYLDGEQIINIGKQSGTQAIHPGYGFLSENSDFAAACERAGLCFIGPSPATIALMAQKDAAKRVMREHVPVVPGFEMPEDSDMAAVQTQADAIGYPLLIKAVGGGGGKGMRLAHNRDVLAQQIEQAQAEARRAFGDGRILFERYFPQARHVEVQIFFDRHGDGVYLFERDCSLQRRYQKVVEFAPAAIDDEVRRRLGEAAVAAGRAVNYCNAGTVEFLLADDGQTFYFLEMNTRLQVEHPVTEAIVGEDLVAWQLDIAANKRLPKQQHELHRRGTAMEMRLYAEDPFNHFAPGVGRINHLALPDEYRLDHAMATGQAVSSRYDPLLGKLIVHADNYADCLQQGIAALDRCFIGGVKNNIAFLKALLGSDAVRRNNVDVNTLETMELALRLETQQAISAVLMMLVAPSLGQSRLLLWRQWESCDRRQLLFDEDEQCLHTIDLGVGREREDNGMLRFAVDGGDPHTLQLLQCEALPAQCHALVWRYDAQLLRAHVLSRQAGYQVILGGVNYYFRQPLAGDCAAAASGADGGEQRIVAPMPGIIQSVEVEQGRRVRAEQTIIIMEAMKMLTHLTVPTAAVINRLAVTVGQNVSEGQLLAEWEAVNE